MAAGGWGDAGLVLVVLWLLAQLNPALPFFEAGNIGGEGVPHPGDFLVTAGSVALSVAGFGFFVSVVLQGAGRGAALDAAPPHVGAVVQVRDGLA